MAVQSKLRKFTWENEDVKEALQKLRDKSMPFAEVDSFLQMTYNQVINKATIYRHCPATPAADVYLPKESVLELKTKFLKSTMLGIKDGERYRKFQKKGGKYECIDCRE